MRNSPNGLCVGLSGLEVRATAPATAGLAALADAFTRPTAFETLAAFQTVTLFHHINPIGFRLFGFVCHSHTLTYGVFTKSETKRLKYFIVWGKKSHFCDKKWLTSIVLIWFFGKKVSPSALFSQEFAQHY